MTRFCSGLGGHLIGFNAKTEENSMDEKVTAALIAAAVSLVTSVFTSVFSARWQFKTKVKELQQAQLKEVLEARIKAYPKVWRILQAQVSNWRMENKPANGEWAKRLHEGLNSCHAMYGVLFSQAVYEEFCEVREAVRRLAESYSAEERVPEEQLEKLDAIRS